jgi:hypothetical protein
MGCFFTGAPTHWRFFSVRPWLIASRIPVDIQVKLAADFEHPVKDASQFRSIVDALQCLTFTRPDIAYAVQQICLHMNNPREPHLTAMKRILRYL